MEISQTELRKYLSELGITGTYTDDEMMELYREVQQRIDQEMYNEFFMSNSHTFYNSYFQRPENKVFKPLKVNTDGDTKYAKNYVNQNANADSIPDEYLSRPIQREERNVGVYRYDDDDFNMLYKEFDRNQSEHRPQKLFDNYYPYAGPKQEECVVHNYYKLQVKAPDVNLDQLADEIVNAKQYQINFQYQPNIRIVKRQKEHGTGQNIYGIINQYRSLVYKTIQPDAYYFYGHSDFYISRRQDSQSEATSYRQKEDSYQKLMEGGIMARSYADHEREHEDINKYIGPYKDTRQQQIRKRADLLDRVNYYKKIWAIQGDPGDRKKRILNAKASRMVNKVLARREVEREQEIQRQYAEYELWCAYYHSK